MIIRWIPREVLAECRKESKNMWKDGKPKKWYYSILIVIIWPHHNLVDSKDDMVLALISSLSESCAQNFKILKC